ncbi:MAG: steroid-22-oyl-CoA synthetase [Frankiales bacterium]|nr:steroid-22-oyl-CoA synthetase [Frankiales bacterium]
MAQPQSLAPPLAEVELPARNVRALLERNATDGGTRDRTALLFGGNLWTHAELLEESRRFAALLAARLDPSQPPHVGVLLDNTPDYVFTLYGAGLLGAVVVGLNTTRRDEHLAADIAHTDVQFVVTEPRHLSLLAPALGHVQLPGGVLVSERFADADDPAMTLHHSLGDSLTKALDEAPPVRMPDCDAQTLWTLLFTSGTAGAPKAVRCTQHRLLTTGSRMSTMLALGHDDVGYAAMPLFHTNSLMSGLAPALVAGASLSLARRFSASRFLPDVRRYAVTWFNYTGKVLPYLLATPEQPDDAENTLRIAFGNEGSPHVVAAATARFGIKIVDVFGSTEGSIALDRTGGPPPGSVGRLRQGIAVVDPDGHDQVPAHFDAAGRLLNPAECVGELVNKLGVGPFEGYYNNDEAMARTTRGGWYWSGDLAYVDEDDWVYFAGRTGDWLRVDGENFTAGPIEPIISRHPDVMLAAVYGVPDADAGDQVMAALVLRAGASFDGARFARWIDEQADISSKWRPRYVRVCTSLPVTPTNKVLTRVLMHEKFRADRLGGDDLFVRPRGADAYVRFTVEDETVLRTAFDTADRSRFWDL